MQKTKKFIEKAIDIHGDKYDYSKTVYVSAHKKVKIICKIHGLFEQVPNSHKKGRGCSQCGINSRSELRRLGDKVFTERAVLVHGKKYDYSLVDYVNSHSNIKIKCSEHGVFEQQAVHHLNGSGCPACQQLSSRSTSQAFIEKAIFLHSGRYDYSLTEYETARKKVKIICNDHGIFEQIPGAHLSGVGCKQCYDYNRLSAIEFCKKAVAMHGDKYNYEFVEYDNANKKVNIFCREHGMFAQVANDHLRGCGCPGCAVSGFDQTKSGILYYIRFDSELESPLYKIGITNYSADERIKTMYVSNGIRSVVLREIWFENGAEARKLEKELHNEYAEHRYYGDDIMTSGNTELFVKDVLGYDSPVSL